MVVDTTAAAQADFGLIHASHGWRVDFRGHWTPEAKLLCTLISSTLHRSLHMAQHVGGGRMSSTSAPPRRLGILDAAMGDLAGWQPPCLEQLMRGLPNATRLHYHGVDVVPSAVHLAERRRDALLQRVPRLSTQLSVVDLTKPGMLSRAVRNSRVDVILCHGTLQHLDNREIAAVLRSFGEVAAQQRAEAREAAAAANAAASGPAAVAAAQNFWSRDVYMIADNQPDDAKHAVNDDEALRAAVRRAGGLRNATHRVDLVAAPFNLDPIEGKPRFVGRPSDAGPRIDYSVDFVRVFRVEPVGVDPRDDA